MAFELPPLPYPKNALEPHTSAKTLEFHHGKHHEAYVTNLNKLVKGSPMATSPRGDHQGDRQGRVQGRHLQQRRPGLEPHLLLELHEAERRRRADGRCRPGDHRDLGGYDKFKEEFKAPRLGQFGSGWAWLVAERRQAEDHQDAERR